jgi:hypothetical protein
MSNAQAMQVDTGDFVRKYVSIFCPTTGGDAVDIFKKFDLPEHRDILDMAFGYFCPNTPLPLRGEGADHSSFKIRSIYTTMYLLPFRKMRITRGPAKTEFIERLQRIKPDMPNDVSAADEAWLKEHLDAVLHRCVVCQEHMMPGAQYADFDCTCVDKYTCEGCLDGMQQSGRSVRCPGCNGSNATAFEFHVVDPVVVNHDITDDPPVPRRVRARPAEDVPTDVAPAPVIDVYAELQAARREADEQRRERERIEHAARAEIANRDAALQAQSQLLMQNQASQASSSRVPALQRVLTEGVEVLQVQALEYAEIGQKAQYWEIARAKDIGNAAIQQCRSQPVSQDEIDRFRQSAAPPQLQFVQTRANPIMIDLAPELDEDLTTDQFEARLARMRL